MAVSDLALVLAAAGIVFAAALVSSVAGFAFSALAGAPLLWLLEDPIHTVAMMVTCSIAIQGYGVWALRRHLEWRLLWPFLAGGALTVPLGVWLLAHTPAPLFAIGLGSFLVTYGLYMALRGDPPVIRAGRWADTAAGALGGVTGGLAGFPGAFVTIWCGMRGWPKERQRSVYQPFILLMQVEALGCLGAHAPEAINKPAYAAAYASIALMAAFMGFAVFRQMSGRQFNLAVQMLLVVSGVALLGRFL